MRQPYELWEPAAGRSHKTTRLTDEQAAELNDRLRAGLRLPEGADLPMYWRPQPAAGSVTGSVRVDYTAARPGEIRPELGGPARVYLCVTCGRAGVVRARGDGVVMSHVEAQLTGGRELIEYCINGAPGPQP